MWEKWCEFVRFVTYVVVKLCNTDAGRNWPGQGGLLDDVSCDGDHPCQKRLSWLICESSWNFWVLESP